MKECSQCQGTGVFAVGFFEDTERLLWGLFGKREIDSIHLEIALERLEVNRALLWTPFDCPVCLGTGIDAAGNSEAIFKARKDNSNIVPIKSLESA